MAYARPTGKWGWRSARYNAFGAPRSHAGRGNGHNGVDLTIEDDKNGPLVALDRCRIIRTYWSNGGGGWIVEIELPKVNGKRRTAKYMHCLGGDSLPQANEMFEKGEVIAYQGRTGNALDEHLHLEIYEDGRAIDPWPLMEEAQYNAAGVDGASTIRLWSLGGHTKYLQTALTYRGYTLMADGDFGPKTEAAVKAFQADAGLGVDGVVGPNTWAALIVERISYT